MTAEITVLRKPVQRVETLVAGLREGSTGMVVAPRLDRVWAVADTASAERETRGMQLVPRLAEETPAPVPEPAAAPVQMAFYRKYTEALLRRYARMRMSPGRVPSMLGRELFRGSVTHYTMHGFDDVVIFCCDVEKQIERLGGLDRQLIYRIAVQGYTHGEVAGMIGVSLRSVYRKYGAALDRLTRTLMEANLLEPQKFCQ